MAPQTRDEKALSMRVAGVPVDRIAAKFGWTIEEAQAAIERALLRVTVDRNPEGVAQARRLTAQRLDGLLENVWPAAADTSDPIIQMTAVKTALSIIDRQVALDGQNAPKESVVTHAVDTGTIAATMERLFAARAGVIEADVVVPTAIASAPEIFDADLIESDERTD